MHWDGKPLPDPGETAVLHDFLLVLSDDLPDLAARWLAAGVADTPSVRVLAGADPHDPWAVEELLASTLAELAITVADDTGSRRSIVVDWLARTWLDTRNTRRAVAEFSMMATRHPDLHLGFDEFVGLEEEWEILGTPDGGWGRSREELERRAAELLAEFLRPS